MKNDYISTYTGKWHLIKSLFKFFDHLSASHSMREIISQTPLQKIPERNIKTSGNYLVIQDMETNDEPKILTVPIGSYPMMLKPSWKKPKKEEEKLFISTHESGSTKIL